MEERRKRHAETEKRRIYKLKAKGICTHCGLKFICSNSTWACEECQVKLNKRINEYQRSLLKKGMCVTGCGKPLFSKRRCKECTEKNNKRNREQKRKESYTIKGALKRLKQGAEKQKFPFDLNEEDLKKIMEEKKCPIKGCEIIFADRFVIGLTNEIRPSFDKVIPSLGYVKGNVRRLCGRHNRLKDDCTLEELKAIVEYVENHLNR